MISEESAVTAGWRQCWVGLQLLAACSVIGPQFIADGHAQVNGKPGTGVQQTAQDDDASEAGDDEDETESAESAPDANGKAQHAASAADDPRRKEKLTRRLQGLYRQALLQYQEVKTLKAELDPPAPTGVMAYVGESVQDANNSSEEPDDDSNIKVSVGGQINRGLMYASTSGHRQLSNVDNGASPSRLNVRATAGSDRDGQIGGFLELAIASNGTVNFHDDAKSDSSAISLRHADLFFNHREYGKFSIGQGSMASDGTSEIDLSGTSAAMWAGVQHVGGGFQFGPRPSGNNSSTAPIISDLINHYDGLGRLDRMRYDTPSYNGFMGSTSFGENNTQDIALRYHDKLGKHELYAGVAYSVNDRAFKRGPDGSVSDSSVYRMQRYLNGSASWLLPNGLNFTTAYGKGISRFGNVSSLQQSEIDILNDRRDQFLYGKLGYIFNVFDFGRTAISLDTTLHDERRQKDERAYAFGIGGTQRVDSWGAEFYASARMFRLDLPKGDALAGGGSRSDALGALVNSGRDLSAEDDILAGSGRVGDPDNLWILFTGVKFKL